MNLPRIIAHRGASAYAPENTIAAFKKAQAQGANWIECDVRLTACETPMILHDPTLDRTTDHRGTLAAMQLEEIAGADAGSWFDPAFADERIPTLEALLAIAAAHQCGLNLEIKTEDAAAAIATAEAVASLVQAHPEPLLITSFARPAVLAWRAIEPGIACGFLVDGWIDAAAIGWAAAQGCATLNVDGNAAPDDPDAAHHMVDAAKAAGLVVVAYTVNDLDRARLLLAAGVTSIITDRPGGLAAALDRLPD